MKRIIGILMAVLISSSCFGAEFKWYRARNLMVENDIYKKWDVGTEYDVEMLEALEKYTTLKVDKKVYNTTFEDIDKISQYPLVFMMSAGDIKFNDIEVKNMREYCNRGGFIFADDCYWKPLGGDAFFKSFKRLVETKIFPGKKMELLPLDHPIYHCHFDLNKGLPWMQGVPHGGYGMSDDKGRLLIFLSPADIHCGWSSDQVRLAPQFLTTAKREEALKMAVNIVVYALTH